jgi:hypothetical protein
MTAQLDAALETHIAEWRSYATDRRALSAPDIDELEGHLRDQVETLSGAGLSSDEAFLVAVKRIGALDALSLEFAREHSERLWKQLVLGGDRTVDALRPPRTEAMVAVGLAIAAAAAFKVPALLGFPMSTANMGAYTRNFSLFVLPFLTAYFVWKRSLDRRVWLRLIVAFVAAVVFANLYPFRANGATQVLTTLHLPIALWLVVGLAYAGDRWARAEGRMDFVRFSGELLIYYALIAFGGMVFVGFTVAMFQAIGLRPEALIQNWVVPCGILGAVIISSWLVEAKQSVVENMAPVLTRIFTPLFAVLLIAFLASMAITGNGIDVARNVLIGFDLLLALVLGLVLYAISARDPEAPPNLFDVLQLVLVASALLVDVVALGAIARRISEFGFSPNKVAALGENLVLLVNLSWSGWLYWRFIRTGGGFAALERWQTRYLPVYATWAAFVVVVFPPLFRWI